MLNDNRISKDEYYLNIAKEVSARGTCLRRCYGAVIVKDDAVVSTGYAGAPKGYINCNQIGSCIRQSLGIPAGQQYELCRSVHAEMNAIINASKSDMKDATLYLFGRPSGEYTSLEISECCAMCKRMIVNAGIKYVKSYKNGIVDTIEVSLWVEEDQSVWKPIQP